MGEEADEKGIVIKKEGAIRKAERNMVQEKKKKESAREI